MKREIDPYFVKRSSSTNASLLDAFQVSYEEDLNRGLKISRVVDNISALEYEHPREPWQLTPTINTSFC